MSERLIFEAEPFEAYSTFEADQEEQPDAYSEFDLEEEFDAEPADVEWEEEARRGRSFGGRRSASRPRTPSRGRRPINRPRPPKRWPWWVKRRPRGPFGGAGSLAIDNEPPEGTEYIRWAQSSLNAIMGLQLPIDGIMGPATRSAVRSFQQRQGLPVDGIVGPDTERALITARAGQPPEPANGATDQEWADELGDFDSEFDGFEEEDTVDRPSREFLAIQRAIQQGVRSENDLTNMAFFARHPERKGRKLSREEPNFQQLSREWLDIRDRVVRPALARATAAGAPAKPSTVPVGGGDADLRWSDQRTDSLEPGVGTVKTAPFRPDPSDTRDVVLGATAAAEGGYDTVNLYDRGIISWGIMQWTAHAGSLQNALGFIKHQLTQTGQSSLWAQLFPNLDVRLVSGQHQLVHRGSLVAINPPEQKPLRLLFRGVAEHGRYDRGVIQHWARVFAHAGRHPVIQRLQREYAHQELARVLNRSLGDVFKSNKYRRVRDYVGTDLKATTLYFGMWTQNPANTYAHLRLAIDRLAQRYGSHDITRWPAGWQQVLADEFERVLRASRFAYWGDAKAREAKPRPRVSRTQKILTAMRSLIQREIAGETSNAWREASPFVFATQPFDS